MAISFDWFLRRCFKIGQEVVIYDYDKFWDKGKFHHAKIINFIPRKGKMPLLTAELKYTIKIDGFWAKFAILELRYEDAKWINGEICHIKIYESLPEIEGNVENIWNDPKVGIGVANHGVISSYKKKYRENLAEYF